METRDQRRTPPGYREDIDGLRGIAVLAVVANHFDASWLESGYLGVDVFFVISGYVITKSLLRNPASNLRDMLVGFYCRRVKRLYPALLICVVLSSLLISLITLSPQLSLKTGMTATAGISNMYLRFHAKDYFAPEAELNMFTHTWSLGVEEQFYLLFPFLVWACILRGRSNEPTGLFVTTLASLSALSLAFYLFCVSSRPLDAFFLMPARFWELAVGALIYSLSAKNFLPTCGWSKASLAALALAVSVLFAPLEYSLIATPLMVLLVGMLMYLARPDSLCWRILTLPSLRYAGRISYSLYLWHWTVLVASRWTVGVHGWTVPIQCALIVVAASLSYHLLEVPLRTRPWAATQKRTIALGMSAAAGAAVVGAVLLGPLRESTQLVATRVQGAFPPAFKMSKRPQENLPCHLPENVDSAISDCFDSSGERNIYIVGDSHASNHFWSIESAIADSPDTRASVLIENGFMNSLLGRPGCDGKGACIPGGFEKTLSFFRSNLREQDIVVFSWARDRVVLDGEFPRRVNSEALRTLRKSLSRLVSVVSDRGATLVLVEDIPKVCPSNIVFGQHILREGRLELCSVPVAVSRKDRDALSSLYREFESKSVLVFDPHDDLCHDGLCEMVLPSVSGLIYSDVSPHFSETTSSILTKQWRRFFSATNAL